jgi:peptide-methionine (S)-S-oxide reductase
VNGTPTKESELEKATFGAGCFWGVEAAFRQIPGVVHTRVGYTGGHVPNPTYEMVCSHSTGHAEAVEITYDPERVSYEKLLDVFWAKHNPTTKDRQGLDIGSQYRSAVFFHSPDQQATAEQAKEEQQAKLHWPRKIVTEIVPASEFYEAEDYHQQYLEKRGRSSCTVELAQTSSG